MAKMIQALVYVVCFGLAFQVLGLDFENHSVFLVALLGAYLVIQGEKKEDKPDWQD